LLSGSVDLSPKTLAILLGATDAGPGSGPGRLVTAMPLRSERLYALCFTWKAPEVSRPGAVWSHVLLAPFEVIASAGDPFAIAGLARRPDPSSLKSYTSDLDESAFSPRHPELSPPVGLLEDVLAAAYVASNDSVVVQSDLEQAELALAATWRMQWPMLRTHFSFRTRDVVRDSKRADVTVARRLRGPSRQSASPVRPLWVSEMASELRGDDDEAPLLEFIREFGAFDAPEPASVGRLANVYVAIRNGSAEEIRDAVANAYPSREQGQLLKRALFGSEVSDVDRSRAMLVALLGSGVDGWDEFQLHLPEQIAALIATTGIETFANVLAPAAGEGVRRAARLAIAQRHEPSDVAVLSQSHLDLVLEVVTDAPELLESPEAWRKMPERAASEVLRALGTASDETISAAASGGHVPAVLAELGVPATLRAVANAGDFGAARAIAADVSWTDILAAAETDERVALLAAATAGQRPLPPTVLTALETYRSEPDEIWLRAAVAALVSPSTEPQRVLPVVFGRLHNAMTSDRLPRDAWRSLDPLLPESPDPAQRLRRYLVTEARRSNWSATEFSRAIADAGPFASQLQHDFGDHDDDWFVSVAKSVLRAFGLIGR